MADQPLPMPSADVDEPVTSEPPVEYASVHDSLKATVENDKLRENTALRIYRPESTFGDGGIADALRHEKDTGEKVGEKWHTQTAAERSKNLDTYINDPNVSLTDREIAKDLKEDLDHASNYPRTVAAAADDTYAQQVDHAHGRAPDPPDASPPGETSTPAVGIDAVLPVPQDRDQAIVTAVDADYTGSLRAAAAPVAPPVEVPAPTPAPEPTPAPQIEPSRSD